MYSQSHGRGPFYVFSLLLLLVFTNQSRTGLTPALQESQWPVPQTIRGYDPETWPPLLIADQNHTVHAFSYQWLTVPGGEPIRVIVYNQWSFENGWTAPVDILMSPVKEARLLDVYLDKNGYLHLAFFGGDNTSADIYYSQAPAILAEDARSWSVPIIVGQNAGDPEGAALVEGDQASLYIIYSGRQMGNGLYVVNSSDGGQNWSEPTPIFFTFRDAPHISDLHVIKSKLGTIHALWAVNNDGGQGRGIYYARSKNGDEWDEPVLLAYTGTDLGTQAPNIFAYEETIFAFYVTQVNQANKMVMRRSSDDGRTWEDQFTMFHRHEGVNGPPSLVVDGNNDLHLFFGQRISAELGLVHGMWHSMYKNGRWIEPEPVVRGIKVLDKEGFSSFDPNSARAVVSQGNVILVTWRTDPGSKGNGVWYTFKKIDAPELPVEELPIPATFSNSPIVPADSISVEDTPSIPPVPTSIPLNEDLLDNPTSLVGVGRIFGGVAVVTFLLLIAFLFFAKRR